MIFMTHLFTLLHHRFTVVLRLYQWYLILLVGVLGVGCTAPIQTPAPIDEVSPAPSSSAEEIEEIEEIEEVEEVEEVFYPPEDAVDEIAVSAWESIVQSSQNIAEKDSDLLAAAIALKNENRVSEAKPIGKLIQFQPLSPQEKIEFQILAAEFLQADSRHRRAIRLLRRILRNSNLDHDQRIRALKLRILSLSNLDESFDLVTDMIQLHSLLPDTSEKSQIGHQLWKHLYRLSIDQLATELGKTDNSIEQEWYKLALGIHSKRADPYAYQTAIDAWQNVNPEHPANHLIQRTRNSSSRIPFEQVAVLLPLTSELEQPAKAFLDGLLAQHNADSNPLKPKLKVIDIGNNPAEITQYYYRALNEGANFVIGPLGIDYVSEMARYGDFIVDTLLLGKTTEVELPAYVYQFALAPEEEGMLVARQAWQDGHTTALVVMSSENWAARTVNGFVDELERLGGSVIQIQEYPQNQADYSESIELIFNVNSSVERYSQLKDISNVPIKFNARRRQDADFLFLVADSGHGRLIKPHIDFLNAYNLPVYSTSRILSTDFDKLNDQDLTDIRFPEMDWLIDKSHSMTVLQRKIERRQDQHFQRIFAMGIDSYNIISYLHNLREKSDARFHGVTSVIGVNEAGVVFRTPSWAKFEDGVAEIISNDVVLN